MAAIDTSLTTAGGMMEYEQAYPIAANLLERFRPYCQPGHCVIAGSLRRGEAEVGDIEIVVEPTLDQDMFGEPSPGRCALDAAIDEMLAKGELGKAIKNGLRYKQIALHQEINLDLFIARPPTQWGVLLAIRTGPKEFSRWIVTQRNKGGVLPSPYRVKGNGVYHRLTDELSPMPTELHFFRFLGLGWIEPRKRSAYVPDIWNKRSICPGHKGHMSGT